MKIIVKLMCECSCNEMFLVNSLAEIAVLSVEFDRYRLTSVIPIPIPIPGIGIGIG